jgi:tetratricopeptide (TPR) repeat protein
VLKASAKDPARRYPSAEALRADLAQLQRGQSVKRKRTIRRRLAVVAKVGALAGLVALTILGAFLFRQTNYSGKPRNSGEWRQLEMKGTKNREAWNAYVTGLRYYERETADGSAIEYLNEATRLDPKFAQPHAALAEIYRWNDNLFPSEQEALSEGKKAALQALALDDSLAQAHKEVGFFAAFLDRDFSKAEKELKRAIQLSPEYSNGHAVYSWLLLEMRRFEEAKKEMKLALSLDPVFTRSMCTASIIFRAAGEEEEAVRQVRRALKLEPNYWLAFQRLGEFHEEKGEFTEAIEAFQKAAVAHGLQSEKAAQRSADLNHAFLTAGARGYWQKKLELADLRSKKGGELYDIAVIYTRLGETSSALDYLEKAEAQKSSAAFHINFDRCFDSVRSDPRFQTLLRKLGLEKYSGSSHGDAAR